MLLRRSPGPCALRCRAGQPEAHGRPDLGLGQPDAPGVRDPGPESATSISIASPVTGVARTTTLGDVTPELGCGPI